MSLIIIIGIGIILLCVLGILIYFGYFADTHFVKVNKKQVMEFKTSMDLTGLPIITFYQGRNKYHFLLDTGSNISYINSQSDLEVQRHNIKDTFMGADGTDASCEWGSIKFYRNGIDYETKVAIANLDAAFTELKNCWGVTISGILGNDFFVKYKYCLDFKELVVYVRK